MLRYMNGSKISEKYALHQYCPKFDNLSVNQLNAQMKIVDMWKANNCEKYPTKLIKTVANEFRPTTRAVTNGKLQEIGILNTAKNTFYNDGVKAWNKIPENIKKCKTIVIHT